ncbi:MAG: transglutaminase-like domain-containing protein [Nanoarchaeota archaeon]|nr:transglutaminase-like domain-containing protein [Nanoarchaeota archaeon]
MAKTFGFTKQELSFFHTFTSPNDIQVFLDSCSYNTDKIIRSPRYVIKTKKAHCQDGATFAAAALRLMGHRPLIVDLVAVNDDDHILAVFKKNGKWGAIGKSNFTTLRFREPLYRTIRELVMSYFDFYFNSIGEKTLRTYSLPLDLSIFDKDDWMTTEEDTEYIGDYIMKRKHFNILSKKEEKSLAPVSKALLEAGLLGSNPDGLFKPEKK